MAAAAGKRLADELEVRRDVVIRCVVARERFAEIEDDVAVELGEGVQALERAVEHMQRWLVPELRERVDHFVLDLFLVEGADERRLAVRARRVFLGLPPIVENDDFEFSCH